MSDALGRLTAALADRYRLEREVGHGGMATVYLAQDVRHDRRVAVKVLRPELAAMLGAERFLAEIKVTANLQHPHILPLHDSGEADGFLYYVMPFVEGESLRDLLSREKQLPIPDALRIAREAASALDYAHRHGIIHRDIKPENILIHDGQALVADFGIALAVRAAGGNRMTETGLSLGTPHYMSPEQAMGERDLSPRSDIYSLGSVVYEMLVGEPPFTGVNPQAIVAKVLTERAHPIRPLRATVSPQLEEAVLRSLEKLPADRWATAAEFAHALDAGPGDSLFQRAAIATGAADVPVAPAPAWPRHSLLPWLVSAALAIALVLFGFRLKSERSSRGTTGPVAFSVDLEKGDLFNDEPAIAISPDGTRLVVSGERGGKTLLLSRQMGRMGVTPLPGSEDGFRPFFSPDGHWIGFSTGEKLRKIPVDGGSAVDLADADWGGGTWGPDGTIVYTQSYKSGLWRVPPNGGTPEMLTSTDTARHELAHFWPQFLPDGRHVLFTNFSTPIARARIEVLDLKTGARKVLVDGAVFGRFVPGHLLFTRGQTVLAVSFDPATLTVSGSAIPVIEDVASVPSNAVSAFAVSESGAMAYVPASSFAVNTQPVWVDRTGVEHLVTSRPGLYFQPRIAPDGRRVAIAFQGEDRNSDVWIYEPGRDIFTRLTFGEAGDFNPLWTPDGRRVIYTSERPVFELYWRAADASTPEQQLLASEFDKYAGSISPDGKTLSLSVSGLPSSEIWLLPLDGSGPAKVFLKSGFNLRRPAFSPDGHWLAFDSDESGENEIYIESYPDPTKARRQVSIGGGADPVWTRGGRELVYRRGDSVRAATVNPATGETGRPVTLFSGPYVGSPYAGHGFDAMPDGSRFLMIKRPDDSTPRRVNVELNWLTELRRKPGTQ
jgi:serine/threonine-protein kinase